MFQGVAIKAVVAVAVTAAAALFVPAVDGQREDGAHEHSVPADRPAASSEDPPPSQGERATGGAATAPQGTVEVRVGDDGMRWGMEHHDPSTGASGSAGVSMGDDGFRLHLHSDSAEGRGGAEVSMGDDGMVLRFDVDEPE